jgi:SAM-dependent methyltransferase
LSPPEATPTKSGDLNALLQQRQRGWLQWLQPPAPLLHDPDELKINAPLGRYNLYIGGAGTHVDGYVNLDLFTLAGVDVAANAEALPFPDHTFQRIECDAVLEHVHDPVAVMREMERVLRPGGFLHVVTPFCHPFHEYPKDYRRFTIDGLLSMRGQLVPVKSGWRTGPTATVIVFALEYAKLWMPNRLLRGAVHYGLGWLLSPLRYLDIPLRGSARAARLGNHCYVWYRKNC